MSILMIVVVYLGTRITKTVIIFVFDHGNAAATDEIDEFERVGPVAHFHIDFNLGWDAIDILEPDPIPTSHIRHEIPHRYIAVTTDGLCPGQGLCNIGLVQFAH